MAGNRNRTAGHSFERWVVMAFKLLGYPEACTTRYSSKQKDDAKVDIDNVDPFNVQCKFTATAPNMHELLRSMPKDNNHNIVYHKRKNKGVTVTMMVEDWHEIIKRIK